MALAARGATTRNRGISRYLVIALAFVAAALRAQQGEWLAAVGLAGLGAGLLVLKLASNKPALRPLAYLSFFVTALSMGVVLIRMYWDG